MAVETGSHGERSNSPAEIAANIAKAAERAAIRARDGAALDRYEAQQAKAAEQKRPVVTVETTLSAVSAVRAAEKRPDRPKFKPGHHSAGHFRR